MKFEGMRHVVFMLSVCLAGADLWSSQKDIQETQTIMKVGIYMVTT